ncbi:hypothetical protein HN997_02815 [archaeon]|jgi:hypothetical protein|nr:hypothetical protein [archaeon]
MRKIGDDKKAQQLTIGTLIIIVLGIAVLAFLIYGFSTGWGNLWEKFTAYGGGRENADTIRQACILACTGGQENQYCESKRTLNLANGKTLKGSCINLKSELGLSTCDTADCTTANTYKRNCEDLGGKWENKACATGVTDLTGDAKLVDKTTGKATADTHCCAA